MKKRLFSLCILSMISVLFWLSASEGLAQNFREFPPGSHWKQFETEHFILVYPEQHRGVAQHVATLAEPIHKNVTEFLQSAPTSKTYIILTDHRDMSNGYASPLPDNKIVLYLHEPGAGMAPSFGLASDDWLSLVLTHEYTHIVHTSMTDKWYKALGKVFGRITLPNAGLPIWIIEGLAVYAETKFEHGRGAHPYYDMMMRTEVLEDSIKTLDQMGATGLRTWPMGNICYLYGYFFLNYLSETYGEETLVEFNHKNAQKFPLFSRNIFKKVYKKNEKALWEEWREAIKKQYERQLAEIQSQPLTDTQPLSQSGYFTRTPVVSPDGVYVYYIEAGAHELPALIQYRLRDGENTRLIEESFSGNFSLSPDGQKLYFSKNDVYQIFSSCSDLYVLDIPTRKVQRLTKGLRAFDPATSPDGNRLVFTTTDAGSMNLMQLDLATGTITPLLETTDHTQFRHPTFSSDGAKIALQVWKQGGFQDIYLIDSNGGNLIALTRDRATDEAPVWAMNDEYILFGSDRTGVPNIFAYSLENQALYQLTNTLTGVFNPAITPDNAQLVMEHYSGNGMDIHLAKLQPETWNVLAYTQSPLPDTSAENPETSQSASERSYTPFPSLRPKFWLPSLGVDEEGVQLGAMTAGQDALGQHRYALAAMYGFKSERLGFFGNYTNRQFYPEITLFGSDSAHMFDDIFRNPRNNEKDYWQREQLAGISLKIPLYQRNDSGLYFSTGYRYKNFESVTDDSNTFSPLPDEGALSGVSAGIIFGYQESSIYSIAPEKGVLTSITYRRDDEIFGSDYNLDTVVGDIQTYLSVPGGRHHVLALRALGGLSDGDTLSQGVFQLGGYALDHELTGLDQQRFFLRGYDENAVQGDRFALGSLEYRFPCWYPQRGLWGDTLFFDSLVGVVFSDAGNAWNDETSLSDFKAGFGGELRLNVTVKNSLPLTIRLGFAQGLEDDLGESQVIYGLAFNF